MTELIKKEIKNIHLSFDIKSLEQEGSFAGYASVFNVIDSYNDMLLKGAFTNTLKEKNQGSDVKMLWQHHSDQPIGKYLKIQEDNYGLFVEGQLLLNLQKGKEVYELVKRGIVNGLSIGYSVKSSKIMEEKSIRIISEVDLWEISLVTFPANEKALVTFVKNTIPETVRDFEHLLRKVGFSRSKAKAITTHGFHTNANKEMFEDINSLNDSIDKAINILES